MTGNGGRSGLKRGLALAMGSVLLSCVAPVNDAHAFSENIHKSINSDALNFLRPAVLDDIADEHDKIDSGISAGLDERHFDDCEFDGAAEFLRDRYEDARSRLTTGNVWSATDEFGQALHPAQDLYSHSNWVELGYPLTPDNPATTGVEVRRSDLIPLNNANRWSAPRSLNGNPVRGDILLGGDDWAIPAKWSIDRDGGGYHVPTLINSDGDTVGRLLVTGEGYKDDECDTPVATWPFPRAFDGFEHKHLNKDTLTDNGGAPAHRKARALATLQTGAEWCRLVRNAAQTGTDGLLLTTWVRSRRSPHPRETLCDRLPRPNIAEGIRVDIKSIRVLDSGESDHSEAGEIQFSTALYDSGLDFHRSTFHTTPLAVSVKAGQSVPVNKLPPPSILCVPPETRAFTFAINGWDNDDRSGDPFGRDFDDKGDADELLRGFQLRVSGNPPASLQTATSRHLQIHYRVTRDAALCPRIQ